jgi:hypothetical protein
MTTLLFLVIAEPSEYTRQVRDGGSQLPLSRSEVANE